MGLLNFESSTDEIVWVSDALLLGWVEADQLLDVVEVVQTKSGKGYLITCEKDGYTIGDFTWKNSKAGKMFTALITNPSLGDGNKIQLKMQAAISSAVLQSVEDDSTIWLTFEEDDRLFLRPAKKQKQTPVKEKPEAETSSSQPSPSLNSSAAK